MMIPADQFPEFVESHLVVHHMSDGTNVRIRVISESSPSDSAVKAIPSLEDAYLWLLRGQGNNVTSKSHTLAV
jgi:hypothetical protein